MKIEIIKHNGVMYIENHRYGKVSCALDAVDADIMPSLDEEYIYLVWSDLAWEQDYYVNNLNQVMEIPSAILGVLPNLCEDWIQPLGQEGNPTLEIAKSMKLTELNNTLEHQVKLLVRGTSIQEQVTWTKQEVEARTYIIDNAIATPMLSTLVVYRGLEETVLELANKIILNADTYSVAHASILGLYQAKQKQLNIATSVAQVLTII